MGTSLLDWFLLIANVSLMVLWIASGNAVLSAVGGGGTVASVIVLRRNAGF